MLKKRFFGMMVLLWAIMLTFAFSGCSSTEEDTPTSDPLGIPANLTWVKDNTDPNGDRITLSWDPVPGAGSYSIYESDSANGDYTWVGDESSASVSLNGIGQDIDVYFRVSAIFNNGSDEGDLSAYVRVRLTANMYTITYQSGADGTPNEVYSQSKPEGISVNLRDITYSRDGYNQTGWSDTDGGQRTHNLNEAYSTNADITLYPFWTYDGTNNPGTAITYIVQQMDGNTGTTTTGLAFTFSESIAGMGITAADITVTGAASIDSYSAFTDFGNGKNWILTPITVNSTGTAYVTIDKNGIAVETKDVTVYKAGGTEPDPDPDPDPDDPGNGTASRPFKVDSVEKLKKVGTATPGTTIAVFPGYWTLDAHYIQTKDIDMTGQNWTPIGTYELGGDIYGLSFAGTYNGNGKTIKGLKNKDTSADNQGMFGYIREDGVVKNVTLVDCKIVGDSSVGCIAGISIGTIENCKATGSVKGDFCVGGIVGENSKNDMFVEIINGSPVYSVRTGTVKGCSTNVEIIANYRVGGIVGDNFGTVKNCYAEGNITNASYIEHIGGVVGDNSGTVEYCYATGNITLTGGALSGGHVGGVVGPNSGTVENCYATGNIVSSATINGGVVGSNSGTATVENCYATGNITGKGVDGGVVGSNSGTIQNCYATGNVTSTGYGGGVAGDGAFGTVINCVALNKSIYSPTASYVDRVIGYGPFYPGGETTLTGTVSNVYAWDDLVVTKDTTGTHTVYGTDVSTGNTKNQSWWTTSAKWDFSATGPWNSVSGDILPTLKNMPGRTQNPQLQP